ncbi:MAG: hypothetical protein Q9177_006765, partial [Variospora cf. flavescens]
GITYDPSVFDNNGGPLHVSYGSYFGPSGTSLQAAMRGAGLNPISGLKSGKLIGYGTMTATVDIRTANSYGCQELVPRRHFPSTASVWSPTSPELDHKDSQPSLISGMKGANVKIAVFEGVGGKGELLNIIIAERCRQLIKPE